MEALAVLIGWKADRQLASTETTKEWNKGILSVPDPRTFQATVWGTSTIPAIGKSNIQQDSKSDLTEVEMTNQSNKSQHSNTTNAKNVKWQDTDHTIQEPSSVENEDDLLDNLQSKCHIDSPSNATLVDILEAFAIDMHTEKAYKWNPTTIKSTNSMAVYFLSNHKIGSPSRVMFWVKKQQPFRWAAKLVDVKDFAKLVPQEFVDQIIALWLPGLYFHPDNVGYQHDLIHMQLLEMYLACYYTSITATVGERLLQQPSWRVQEAMTVPIIPQEAMVFVGWIKDGSMCNIHTWPTIRYRLQHDFVNDENINPADRKLLQQRLHPLPPMRGYVKQNLEPSHGTLWSQTQVDKELFDMFALRDSIGEVYLQHFGSNS